MSIGAKKRKRSRGSVLLLSIFFLIVLSFLATAFFRIIPAEYHSATQAQKTVQSHYAADAGVREAVSFLKMHDDMTETKITAFNNDRSNPASATAKIDENWSNTVQMTTLDALRGIYEVRSVAYLRGRAVRELRTTIANETFAKYALFYDTWGDDFLFSLGSNSIQGPFHTNSFFKLAAPDANYWSDGKAPFVTGSKAEMTFSSDLPLASNTMGVGDGNMYYGGNYAGTNPALVPFGTDGAPNTQRYNKLIEGGREKMSRIQRVEFPEAVTELSIKAWGGTPPTNAALNTLETNLGSVLVNTDQGANAKGGTVAGGIHIQSDATSVRMEITTGNGNHQKIKVRDASDIGVPGPPNTVYKLDVPIYRAWVVPPPRQETVQGACLTSTTVHDPRYEWVNQPRPVTEPHASCGTETVFIPGTGGISTPITVNKTCTRMVDNWVQVQNGTTPRTVCTSRAPNTTRTVQDPGQWQDVPSTYTGAQHYRTDTVNSNAQTPGAYPVTNPTTTWIPSWNSVVEVNDASYKIPYYNGVKVNGETITNPNDPRLVVADGNTVTIKNDYTGGGKNYAEYTVLTGRTNGVVYSNGTLKDVQGINKGSKSTDSEGNLKYVGRTIATNIQTDKSLEISGDILQYYGGTDTNLNDGSNRLRRGQQSPNADNILGIVAKDITIRQPTNRNSSYFQNTRDGDGKITSFNGGLTVYGVLMAGRKINSTTVNGGFGADNTAMQNGDGLGDFNLFGGIISGNARKTQTGYAGAGSHGFRLNLNYDEIAAMNLENFPRTNRYSVTRYVIFSLDSLDQGFGSMSGK